MNERLSLSQHMLLLLLLSRFSRVRLFATPWTVAYQAPLSMGFSRSEYWSGLPFPSPGDLPDPGIEPKYERLYKVELDGIYIEKSWFRTI